jgi:hypothetical protein
MISLLVYKWSSRVRVMVFNATFIECFNNLWAISGFIGRENRNIRRSQRPAASHCQTLSSKLYVFQITYILVHLWWNFKEL